MTRPDLNRLLERAHLAAMSAIRDGRADLYDQVVDTYRESLKALSSEWSRYGVGWAESFASGLGIFETGPLDVIARYQFEEFSEAARLGPREVAIEALNAPYEIAITALPLGATAVIAQMLQLIRYAYEISVTEASPQLATVLVDKSQRMFAEFMDFHVVWRGREALPPLVRREVLLTCFRETTQMLKRMVDLRRDEDFVALDKRWTQVDIDGLEEISSGRGRGRRRRSQDGGEPSDDLDNYRFAARFALLDWALRGIGEPNDPSSRIALHLLGAFPSPADAAQGFDLAFQELWRRERRSPWSYWELEDMPEGEVRTVGTEHSLLRTFVVASLLTTHKEPPFLPAYEWIRNRRDELDKLLESPPTRALATSLASGNSTEEAVPALREAFKRAATEFDDAQRERIQELNLDDARIAAFARSVQKAWTNRRTVANVLRHYDALVETSEVLPDQRIGYRRLLPKAPFTNLPGWAGGELMGTDLGHALARSEEEVFFRRLQEAALEIEGTTNVERFERASSWLADRGSDPNTFFVPVDMAVLRRLGLPYIGNSQDIAGWTMSDEISRRYSGALGEAFSFRLNAVPHDTAFLLDSRAFASITSSASVRVAVESISEEQARELATEHHDLGKPRRRVSLEERIAEIRQSVLVEVDTVFIVSVKDGGASTRFHIEPDD